MDYNAIHTKNMRTLHPTLRGKVKSIIADLRRLGFDAYVASGLRNKLHQQRLVKMGVSKTMNSKHLADKNGFARAADVVTVDKGWKSSEKFWYILGKMAIEQGLKPGILFGLDRYQRNKLIDYLKRMEVNKVMTSDIDGAYKRGWDPAHLELP